MYCITELFSLHGPFLRLYQTKPNEWTNKDNLASHGCQNWFYWVSYWVTLWQMLELLEMLFATKNNWNERGIKTSYERALYLTFSDLRRQISYSRKLTVNKLEKELRISFWLSGFQILKTTIKMTWRPILHQSLKDQCRISFVVFIQKLSVLFADCFRY